MDENQRFENLPQDLPEPHFYGNKNDRWSYSAVGCDLKLMTVPADYDFNTEEAKRTLRARAYDTPMLIRQGEASIYYLYGPNISLDEDKSEWQAVRVDDPNLIQLIKFGAPEGAPRVAVDFTKNSFGYTPLFGPLYQFGERHTLHLGFGFSYIFSAYNYGRGASLAGRACGRRGPRQIPPLSRRYMKDELRGWITI